MQMIEQDVLVLFFIFLFLLFASAVMALDISALPEAVQMIGKEKEIPFENIIRKKPVLIVVGSHDSLVIVQEIPLVWHEKNFSISPEQFISVAAVSKAPWPIKKWIIPGKLEELKEKRDEKLEEIIPDIERSPLLLDFNGDIAKALQADNLGKNGFAAFVIAQSGEIKEVYRGVIKAGDESSRKNTIKNEASLLLDAAQKDMGQ
jgi:hypothetical protein